MSMPPPPIQAWSDVPPIWRRWFLDLYNRTGGTNGRVIVIREDGSDASGALSELEARALAAIPERPDLSRLEARIAELEAQIAILSAPKVGELTARVEDLERTIHA